MALYNIVGVEKCNDNKIILVTIPTQYNPPLPSSPPDHHHHPRITKEFGRKEVNLTFYDFHFTRLQEKNRVGVHGTLVCGGNLMIGEAENVQDALFFIFFLFQ